ncbi:MAG: nicotinamide mononucleotide transporter family protein [Holosporales bacterium]|jgi:nicotinamide riboside transporter PnuC|nr:nicotinamide mononucleotide transporter family protein [Holosporales bacterium]
MDYFQVGTTMIMIVNVYGSVLNSRQRVSCFFVWALGNVLWACVNFYKEIYAEGVQNIIFLGLNVYGFLCWKYTANAVDKKLKSIFCFKSSCTTKKK